MKAAGSTGIAAGDPRPRNRVAVLDSEMSYVDVGEGGGLAGGISEALQEFVRGLA